MIECYPVVLKVYYLSLYLFCSYLRCVCFQSLFFWNSSVCPSFAFPVNYCWCYILLAWTNHMDRFTEHWLLTKSSPSVPTYKHPSSLKWFSTLGAKVLLYLYGKSSLSDVLIHSKQKQIFIELWSELKGKMCCYCGFWIRLLLNQASFWHKLKIAN